MSYREFVDSGGIQWEVWEVIPQLADRRRLRERRTARRDGNERRLRHEPRLRASDGADGWIVFESRAVKKRLRPIPTGWHLASSVELESMCARADRASRTTPRLIE